MESSQPLSIESFSYSWLVPSFETLESSLDASDEAFFIEMDPKLTASKRFFRASPPSQDFNFDFPKSQTPLTLLHADELISNVFIMPVFAKPLKTKEEDFAAPVSPRQREDVDSGRKMRCSSLKRCRRLSKRMLEKYTEFVKPLCRRFSGSRRALKPPTGFCTRRRRRRGRALRITGGDRVIRRVRYMMPSCTVKNPLVNEELMKTCICAQKRTKHSHVMEWDL